MSLDDDADGEQARKDALADLVAPPPSLAPGLAGCGKIPSTPWAALIPGLVLARTTSCRVLW
jgi:hypothetical protein